MSTHPYPFHTYKIIMIFLLLEVDPEAIKFQ